MFPQRVQENCAAESITFQKEISYKKCTAKTHTIS
jgi:hypothetical protein